MCSRPALPPNSALRNWLFWATDQVRRNPRQLALIEATQSGEVVFSLLGGVLLLGDPLPGALGLVGLCLIVGGMVGGSLSAGEQA